MFFRCKKTISVSFRYKSSDKGLLFHPRLSLQRTCHIMQVTHLVPLVGGECDLLLRTTLTAAGICDSCA